jgi:hypothetical protein
MWGGMFPSEEFPAVEIDDWPIAVLDKGLLRAAT